MPSIPSQHISAIMRFTVAFAWPISKDRLTVPSVASVEPSASTTRSAMVSIFDLFFSLSKARLEM